MDTRAYVEIVEGESRRCLEALRTVDLAAPVPSCPGWSAADLAWHLAEVQYFWAAIVADLVQDPRDVEDPERPADEELPALLQEQSLALVTALSAQPPEASCWSWREDGHSVGWVARRQAHEALIHRVDAELAAGWEVAAVDAGLAADGVDDVLAVMLHLPGWGSFEPDSASVAVETADVARRWVLRLGRFTGTSPNTGRTYDQGSARLVTGQPGAGATVRGDAWDLDRWLWGRGGDGGVATSGDRALVGRLREVLAENTQ